MSDNFEVVDDGVQVDWESQAQVEADNAHILQRRMFDALFADEISSSNLVRHAERELTLAGLMPSNPNAPYDGMVAECVWDMMCVFASHGHSGMSAHMTIEIWSALAKFKTLTPITSNPDEWNDVSGMCDSPTWQSRRDPAVFSVDGGKTWYSLEDEDAKG